MLLDTLVHRLHSYPELLQTVSLSQLIKFISLSAALRQDICFAQPAPASPDGPPPTYLPPAVCSFLSEATGITYGLVQDAWHIVRYIVWLHPGPDEHAALVRRALEEHGLKVGIVTVTFYPPHFHCINPLCDGRRPALRKQQARQVVAFTLADGARPAWAINLYCHHCRTTYHHNFYLHAGQRIYYAGIPGFLQVGEHQFVDSGLAALWTDLMVVSWVSATNCARSYEMSLSKSETRPDDWRFSFTLTTEQVWDAFVILALLRDHERRGELLHIPHTGDQRDRFMAAMEHRNTRIVKEGQPELRHYCDRCIRFYEGSDPDSPMRACRLPIVVDGITLGHPCCGVFRCRVPLANNRHRFCPEHADLHEVCAVNGCDAAVVPGSKTCSDNVHQEMERVHTARGTAMFQLKERLLRAAIAHPNDALATSSTPADADLEDAEEWFEVTGAGAVHSHADPPGSSTGQPDRLVAPTPVPCPAKSPGGNVKRKAQFGRRRTHNEEIIVRPCGVILARATFYGAEAVSNVLLMVHALFQIAGAQKPDIMLYDAGCVAQKEILANQEDPIIRWFLEMGLPVDVFHHDTKHTITDVLCQKYCNPANFPELMTPDGKWYFNSSAAEQTNVWLGGYQAICREMLPVKYNFFLDEMIMRRNEVIVERLRKRGFHPNYSPAPEKDDH
ncbi:hypothetical protein FA95DRAFT_1635974 [Auriscalpium vulgare]|uniref:Uncharacterized protein n=1 Tax=Auriscalpium vulgare TaxID=40419 RepID=A0ACB8RFH8_9AGAM|nr:hypothetical protein FA95DRAFT_1635974 [Auriscalpium vulgare]